MHLSDFIIDDAVHRSIADVPAGDAITKAALRILVNEPLGQGGFRMDIESAGDISEDGRSAHVAVVRFPLPPATVALLGLDLEYRYTIEVWTAKGERFTLETGSLIRSEKRAAVEADGR